MTIYRNALPQLGEELFLTDGGLETTLIFHNGIDLPHFASFVLMRDEDGTTALRDYYESYLDIASKSGTGFILESPTWRASADWGAQLGYDAAALVEIELPKAVTPSTRPPVVTVWLSCTAVPAWKTFTSGSLAASSRPRMGSPRS